MQIKHIIKIITLTVISSILLSCVTTRKPILDTLVNDDILVISGYPSTYYVNVIGTTAFTNHNKTFDGLDLSINDVILNNFKTKARDNKYITYSGEKTFDFTKGNWYSGKGFSLNKSISELKEINAKYNSRYLLLIGAESMGDSVFFTNQFFSGYGITRRYLYGQPKTVLYTAMKMSLIDAKTYKVVQTVTTLQHIPMNRLRQEKLHKLDQQQFLIFKEKYPALFDSAIDDLLAKL
jgi:hypothetical protein